MTEAEFLTAYRHLPGSPVLDRAAVLPDGKLGNAIAARDAAIVHATGEPVTVLAVDHATGQITVSTSAGKRWMLAGYEVVVTEPAHHDLLPDDHLEGMTLAQARTVLTAAASDLGRYPQYGEGFFDEWVFGRARSNVRHRGTVILVRGQRCLVNPDRHRDMPGEPPTCTAWITRTYPNLPHPLGSVLVEARHIRLEPGGV